MEPNVNPQNEPQQKKKVNIFKNLKWYEHLAAGWPLILVFIGGAVGGACGGMAYALNAKLFNSRISAPLKYVFSFLIGIACTVLYFLVIVMLVAMFPGLFKR